jgi:hypothetical protein
MTNTAQSLTGRFCDNFEYSGEQLDPSKRPIHFCDKMAIEGYVEWFNNGCDFTVSEYKSLRIKSTGNGKVISKETKVHHTLVTNLSTLDLTEDVYTEEEVEEPKEIVKKKTLKEIKTWFNENLPRDKYGTGPKILDKEKNKEGECYTCITQFDKIYKIRTEKEFKMYEANKKWGFRGKTEKSKDKNKYRVYPVYSNIQDHESIYWWLVYY